jgi:hypothetical protein
MRAIRAAKISLAVAVLFFVGCAGVFHRSRSLPDIPGNELLDRIASHTGRLQTFQGIARMTVATPEASFAGTFSLSLRAPDSLWAKVEGPLGIDMLTLAVKGDSILMYSPWQKAAYRGSLGKVRDSGMLPVDLDSSDVVFGFLGLWNPRAETEDSVVSIHAENGLYILLFHNGGEVWIEPKGPVVKRWIKKDPNGETQWVWEGDSYRRRSEVWLPSIVRISRPATRQRITLQYESISTNHAMKSNWFVVRIPEGVPTLKW